MMPLLLITITNSYQIPLYVNTFKGNNDPCPQKQEPTVGRRVVINELSPVITTDIISLNALFLKRTYV